MPGKMESSIHVPRRVVCRGQFVEPLLCDLQPSGRTLTRLPKIMGTAMAANDVEHAPEPKRVPDREPWHFLSDTFKAYL
jgi:hypothetical protein